MVLNFPGKYHCPHSPPTDRPTDRTYTATQHIDCCEQITTHSVDLPTYLNKKYTPLPPLSSSLVIHTEWGNNHQAITTQLVTMKALCIWEGEQQTKASSANKSFLYGLIHTNKRETVNIQIVLLRHFSVGQDS